MNRISTLILAASIFGVPALRAQDNPFSADARQTYAMIKDSLLKAADKMPAEAYSFRTVPQVRTFGEMIAHIADAQVRMCGVVRGEQVPNVSTGKTSKADLVAALKASFDACDPVYDKMTDAGSGKVKWALGDEQPGCSIGISPTTTKCGISARSRIKRKCAAISEGRPRRQYEAIISIW